MLANGFPENVHEPSGVMAFSDLGRLRVIVAMP
jgi:hypothetical protein